ncbi:MAG TPA: FtsX-like permease family protein [Pseudoclavibacter sp.]|nr:FtsX-like permease family protein [Pseudoclavibacter sp.]
MFFTYLRRELANRRKQTIIISAGMALAIALVVVVNSLSAGIQDAQAEALESIYGVGTDITVTVPAEAPDTDSESSDGSPQMGQQFDFGSDDGTTEDGTTTVNQSQLSTDMTTTTFEDSALDTVTAVDGVSAASATLSLTNTTFNGELPDFSSTTEGDSSSSAQAMPSEGAGGGTGGPNGDGSSSFNVDSFTVLGVDPTADAVGPLSAVTLSEGETLTTNDADSTDAVLDADYATSADLAVGDTIDIGGTEFTIIGTVTSSTTSGTSTSSDVYISLAAAQALSGEDGMISSIYVQAESSDQIDTVADAISAALPDVTVTTESDLADTVSGSLGTAASLISNLGTWLSLIVLVAAIVIAVLFTISGVTRRTREFGTLKAIGWSNGSIVRQVAGESFVQSLIGGLVGAVIGIIAAIIINMSNITLSSSGSTEAIADSTGSGGGMGGGFGGGMMDAATTTATSTDLTLTAPVSVAVILLAVGLAALGGLIAGAFGGWRAAKLRPAEALRAIA